ncbi:MAG: TetR/AcrR family transcriptional regulator [Deltaproteobacteria bacterium]|nr:TetR/AcrR family transcriptional regulator [Deltaproteobacteria bacterium]
MRKNGAKRLKSRERKEQIAAVAGRLFSRKGFGGTTTREIARKARISEATIFKHFKRKGDLYRAIIERSCDDPAGRFILTKRLEGRHGAEVFREVAEFMMERYAEDPSFARLLMFSALERNRFSDIFIRSRGMETLEYLAGHIKDLMDAGHFKRRDPFLCARAFLGMVVHYCVWQEIYGFKRFFSRPASSVVSTFVDIFLNGMEKKEGRR